MLPPQNSIRYRFTASSDLLGRRVFKYDPIGWESIAATLRRDSSRHGTTVDFISDLNFVKDGRAYLLRAYQAAGVQANVRILIEQYDPNEFRWLPYYSGRVHFLEAEIGPTQMKVNLESESWLQKFLARDSVKVDLFGGESASGYAGEVHTPVTVELHSRAILQRYAASQKAAVKTSAQMFGDEGNASHEQLLYFGFDNQETNKIGLGAVAGGWVSGSASSVVPIYTAPGNADLTIDLDLRALIVAYNDGDGPDFETVEGDCRLRIVRAGVAQDIPLIPDFYVPNLGGDYVGDILTGARKFTFNLEKGDEVYLYARYFIHDIGGPGTTFRYRTTLDATFLPGAYFRMSAITTTPASTTKGLLLYEACERLCQALTDEADVFRSDFLGRTDLGYAVDGPGALTMVTGGFQVRGFPPLSDPAPTDSTTTDPRKTLTTDWREFFDSLAAVYGLGWGVEWAIGRSGKLVQVIRVEPISYWYGTEVVLDLTESGILDDTRKVDQSRHYQVVEMGYTTWQAEQVNGLDEFNTKRQWTTPLDVTDNKYSQLSQLATSGTLLEATRRDRYDATSTTDTGNDATNFLVCLLRDGVSSYVTERNQMATLLQGMLSPNTVYNLRLSPGRMLRRHGPVLQAGLQYQVRAQVRFTYGEGNTSMVSQLLGEPAPIVEGDNLDVPDLGQALWRAEQVEFNAPIQREQVPPVMNKPTGRVRYVGTDRTTREGWLLEFKHDPRAKTAAITLLPCLP